MAPRRSEDDRIQMDARASMDAELARDIIENATDYAIFTLDAEGVITSWSPGGERILGYTTAEAIGLDFAELFLEADRLAGAPRREIDRPSNSDGPKTPAGTSAATASSSGRMA
jgi:PAS domain-containing protein